MCEQVHWMKGCQKNVISSLGKNTVSCPGSHQRKVLKLINSCMCVYLFMVSK